jgi:hypothetical protein
MVFLKGNVYGFWKSNGKRAVGGRFLRFRGLCRGCYGENNKLYKKTGFYKLNNMLYTHIKYNFRGKIVVTIGHYK